ncbi:telomere length regulation protein [Exophiala viscosa]|uniref:Telomere length regulation protein n=1 Tax=Exophiala viscosa TaxID=2486360 RepID=A0AAN6E133_9EURO|nr:telomere length regulation protein [Exophiala viscosa]KAI1623980.1 telomere length regulation protein [Exophiala viscosa]
MAALLQCDNGPAQAAQMHPFFRKVVLNHNVPEQQPSSNYHLGLDGTADNPDIQPQRQSNAVPHIIVNDAHVPSSDSKPTCATSPAETSRNLTWSAPERDDLEDENRRTKRRKLSSEANDQDIPTQMSMNSHQRTWHDQLEAAAKQSPEHRTRERNPSEGRSSSRPADLDTGTIESHAEVGRSAGCDEGKSLTPDPACKGESELGDISDYKSSIPSLTIQSPPPEHKLVNTTPKKKSMIGLNAQGKLMQSPKRSPRTKKKEGDQQDHGTSKPVRRSKKVEIRNGKFVSSLRITLPYTSTESGQKIDTILSKQPDIPIRPAPQHQPLVGKAPKDNKSTHPFFLGKLAVKTDKEALAKSENSSIAPTTDDEAATSPKAPKPWKDIVFASRKPTSNRTLGLLPAIWPPASLQHICTADTARSTLILPPQIRSASSKFKYSAFSVRDDEDVLRNFARKLSFRPSQTGSVHLPLRRMMSGKALAASIDLEASTAFGSPSRLLSLQEPLKRRIETRPSPFDRGSAAGPHMWSQDYAPTCWQEVLQVQSQVLHDWLSSLQVHQVQTGQSQTRLKVPAVKKRRKRKSDEMDDFLVDSDEDVPNSNLGGKNAILLVGPSGCGKTASVFAIAQQLGFEVFELHPGMRRSARDIQEKVGDMTQNHQVQQADMLSRASSVSPDDADTPPLSTEVSETSRQSIASFMGPGKGGKKKKSTETAEKKEVKAKSQKQSLILLEEVDILFDEDKGFWTGVQSLISTSKRPVIMTCNDLESVPLEELDLFSVLAYTQPEPDLAVDHLRCIAAAEGHLLSKESIENLYATKSYDLRASITELNFWCQMTVGSHQGGLDWMLPYNEKQSITEDGSITRIVSQDTFTTGLDLFPVDMDAPELTIDFTRNCLEIPASDWVKDEIPLAALGNRLQALDDMLTFSEAKSAMDLIDGSDTPFVSAMLTELYGGQNRRSARDDVVQLRLEHLNDKHMTRLDIADSFEALMEESRIGLPTSLGRKAPSLDNAAQSVVTDVAPYIRCIVEHDLRLEQIRNELGGGPHVKRQRKTRAARAALEGGTKVSTRRDKWFPEILNFSAVLATGNGWPQFRSDELSSAGATPSSSMATEVD